jgi:hypothetical protein
MALWFVLAVCVLATAGPVPRPGTEPIPKLMEQSSLVCKGEVKSAPEVEFVEHPERFTGTATVLIDRCFKGSPPPNEIHVLFDREVPRAGGGGEVVLRNGDYRLFFLRSQGDEFKPVDDFFAVLCISRLVAATDVGSTTNDPMYLLEQDLKAGLRDSDKERVIDSIRVLGNMKHLRSTTDLKRLANSSDPLVKTYAWQALLRLQDYSVLPAVAEFLNARPETPKVLVLPRDNLLEMQSQLHGEMANVRDPNALPYLEDFAVSNKEYLRMAALQALRAINSPHSAPTFLKALDDPNTDNGFSAMQGLLTLAGGGAIEWVPTWPEFKEDPRFYAAKCREWWYAEGRKAAGITSTFH